MGIYQIEHPDYGCGFHNGSYEDAAVEAFLRHRVSGTTFGDDARCRATLLVPNGHITNGFVFAPPLLDDDAVCLLEDAACLGISEFELLAAIGANLEFGGSDVVSDDIMSFGGGSVCRKVYIRWREDWSDVSLRSGWIPFDRDAVPLLTPKGARFLAAVASGAFGAGRGRGRTEGRAEARALMRQHLAL